MKLARMTDDQRAKIVTEIKDKMAEGIGLKDACKRHKISDKSFYNWRNRLGKVKTSKQTSKRAKKHPFVQEIITQTEKPQQLVCLIGGASDIAEAIKQWQK